MLQRSADMVIGGYCHRHTSPTPCAQCEENRIVSEKLVQTALLDAVANVESLNASYVRDYLLEALPFFKVPVQVLEAKRLVGVHLQEQHVTFFVWDSRSDEYSNFSLPIIVTKFNHVSHLRSYVLGQNIERLEKEATDLLNQRNLVLTKLEAAKADLRSSTDGVLSRHLASLSPNIQPPNNQLDA